MRRQRYGRKIPVIWSDADVLYKPETGTHGNADYVAHQFLGPKLKEAQRSIVSPGDTPTERVESFGFDWYFPLFVMQSCSHARRTV